MKNRGFTLIEVLVAVTIVGIIAITQIPRLQGFLEEQVRDEAIGDIRKLSNSLRQFRATQNTDPTNITELINSDFYDGNATLPWGAPFSGSPIQIQDPNSPNDVSRVVSSGWAFQFNARNIQQAALIAEELGDLDAQVVGSAGTTVEWMVNASLLEVNQFQFIARTQEGQELCPTCDEIQIDLDFRDDASIENVEGFDASLGDIVEAAVTQVSLDSINNITMENGQLQVNAEDTSVSGDIEIAQSLTTRGDAQLNGDVSIDGDVNVGRDVNVSGSVTGGFFSATGGDFSTQLASLNDNRERIDSNNAAILVNRGLIDDNASAISLNTGNIASNSAAIQLNSSLIASNAVANNANVGQLSSLNSQIQNNERDISGNSSSISALESDVAQLRARINANAGSIAQLQADSARFSQLIAQCTSRGGCRGISQ